MKMIYNGTPINSMKVKHYEISTSDCDMIASDLQAGKTAVARGKKIVGTGKSFEFAYYGEYTTNTARFIPSNINIIEISSVDYPIKSRFALQSMRDIDFSIDQNIATVTINENEYNLIVSVKSNILTISCDEAIQLQVFYGKDVYI